MENSDLSGILSGVMSNPEIMSKISSIMQDPEAMKRISGVASSMHKEEEPTPPAITKLPQSEDAKNRARLISALKPYLNHDRRDKADKLLGLLSILEFTGTGNFLKRGD